MAISRGGESPAQPTVGELAWLDRRASQTLRYVLLESPSIRGQAVEIFAQAYADAREQASAETGLPIATFPERLPYTREQALDPHFLRG